MQKATIYTATNKYYAMIHQMRCVEQMSAPQNKNMAFRRGWKPKKNPRNNVSHKKKNDNNKTTIMHSIDTLWLGQLTIQYIAYNKIITVIKPLIHNVATAIQEFITANINKTWILSVKKCSSFSHHHSTRLSIPYSNAQRMRTCSQSPHMVTTHN